jgi:hypothetical protein
VAVEDRVAATEFGRGPRAAVGEVGGHRGPRRVDPGVRVVEVGAATQVAEHVGALGRGHAGADRTDRLGEHGVSEHEQRPAHGELFDESPIGVQRAVHRLGIEPGKPRPRRQVDRRRCGGVQSDEVVDHLGQRRGGVGSVEVMTSDQSSAAFGVVDDGSGRHAAGAAIASISTSWSS